MFDPNKHRKTAARLAELKTKVPQQWEIRKPKPGDFIQIYGDKIEDLDTVARGDFPQFAQPTLDFVMLAEVAKSAPASEPVPQESPEQTTASELSAMWLPMLIVSVIVNLILIAVLIAT